MKISRTNSRTTVLAHTATRFAVPIHQLSLLIFVNGYSFLNIRVYKIIAGFFFQKYKRKFCVEREIGVI